MVRRPVAIIVATALMALSVAGCRESNTLNLEPPATKVKIEGTDRYQVILTPQAAERIDLQTTEVAETDGLLSVTSDALLLDTKGVFWVYVNTAPFTYERAVLQGVREVGGQAIFSAGPPAGTPIVHVGVAELWGEEAGVGK